MTNKKQEDGQPTASEIKAAEKEGVLDKVRESQTTQGINQAPIAGSGDPYVGKDEIMPWAYMVDLGLDELKAALDPDADSAIPDNKVAGLLGLERGGKNRTDFVKAYMDRLKIANPKLSSPYDVTPAGPPYTNDVTSVTKL